jgi:AcrR family transcriptional regulator
VYSHFRSKDDLFLALYESRTRREIDRIFKVISTCQTQEESLSRFKKLLVELSRDKTWFLLTLEFKLYSIRHPESRERWVQSYDMIRLAEREFLHEKLFGGLPKDRRQRLNTGVAAIAPVLSALTLETFFEPKHLASDKLRALLFRIFDVLLDPT